MNARGALLVGAMVLSFVLATGRAQAQQDMFLELPGVQGEVTTPAAYANQIAVLNNIYQPETGLLAAAMPILLSAVFARSERTTRDWLGVGMDRDVEALEQILSGEVVETPVGHYLSQLRSRFPGTVVADMLCMLRVQLELSLRAKGMLMARSAGIEVPPDPEVRENLTELRYLEKAVGAVGMLALKPLLAGKERWEQELLRG